MKMDTMYSSNCFHSYIVCHKHKNSHFSKRNTFKAKITHWHSHLYSRRIQYIILKDGMVIKKKIKWKNNLCTEYFQTKWLKKYAKNITYHHKTIKLIRDRYGLFSQFIAYNQTLHIQKIWKNHLYLHSGMNIYKV